MNKILALKIPKEFRNKLPIHIFFVKGTENTPIIETDLIFAPSNFYNTKKMRCQSFYKPAFI